MSAMDYVESFKDGINLVGKMAARGVNSISKQINREESQDVDYRKTGLFYQRHVLSRFGDLTPRIQFCEPVLANHLKGSFVNKLVRSGADKALVAASFALMFGDGQYASDKLREAIALDPQLTDAYFMLGAICLEKGNDELAQESFSKARLLQGGLGQRIFRFIPTFQLSLPVSENLSFKIIPDVSGLNLLLAIALRNGGKAPQALQNLEQILSVMPGASEIAFFLALLYLEGGSDEKVIEHLKDLIPSDNLGVLTVQILIRAWLNRNNPGLAEGIIKKALEAEEIEPHLVCDLLMLSSRVARIQGRVAESSALSQKVKKQYPDYQDLEGRLGIKIPVRTAPAVTVETPVVPEVSEKFPDKPQEPGTPVKPAGSPDTERMTQISLKSKDGLVNIILPDNLVIGREEGDLVLSWDASASRVHSRLYREKGQIWVEDQNSTNGTWINQHRLSGKRVFNRGDHLLVGKTEFYLE